MKAMGMTPFQRLHHRGGHSFYAAWRAHSAAWLLEKVQSCMAATEACAQTAPPRRTASVPPSAKLLWNVEAVTFIADRIIPTAPPTCPAFATNDDPEVAPVSQST